MNANLRWDNQTVATSTKFNIAAIKPQTNPSFNTVSDINQCWWR